MSMHMINSKRSAGTMGTGMSSKVIEGANEEDLKDGERDKICIMQNGRMSRDAPGTIYRLSKPLGHHNSSIYS